jgi:glycosyltransferase involved in cell wall biosynthesis
MGRMSISVALCTWNGERFLPEQLNSLAHQARPPDELVVFDDASTDGTAGIVQAFAAEAPFPVRLTVNERNCGVTKNFEQCIAACRGDIIALCDQDDVWLESKLAVVEQVMAESHGSGFAWSDADLVDESLCPIGYTLWEGVRAGGRVREALAAGRGAEVLLQRNVVTGATMAFRSEFRDILLPIPPQWMHDGWIALLLSMVSGCRPIDEPLLKYRQHRNQQIGGRKLSLQQQLDLARSMDRQYFQQELDKFIAARNRLVDSGRCDPEQVRRLFEPKIRHQQARLEMRHRRWRTARWPLVFAELIHGRYRRYSIGCKSLAQDLFL